jgi:hypothetical protein
MSSRRQAREARRELGRAEVISPRAVAIQEGDEVVIAGEPAARFSRECLPQYHARRAGAGLEHCRDDLHAPCS